jgi:membrane protease YdiL (CAAX protease family)
MGLTLAESAKPLKRSWQRARWTQALAILLGIAPIYGATILMHLSQDRAYSLNDVLFYSSVIAPVLFVSLVLLLRFLCGESFGDLNLKKAGWWQDLFGGIALAALTLGGMYFIAPVVGRALPSAPQGGLGNVFTGLASDPWRLALFLGPGLAIGAAGFEELARVFLLTRWWKIASGAIWRWLGVLVSAVLFGLVHIYQGPAGMANTALIGLVLGVAYLRFGRIWPLIISHYLHDALQIVLLVYLIRTGAAQF